MSEFHGSVEPKSQPTGRSIPVTLGKPSLRLRLEDYYSLVAPDVLTDQTIWRSKFDLIYERFGGTHEKERLLENKLAKKYGTTVKLLLAEGTNHSVSGVVTANQHAEEWYKLRAQEANSGVLNFCSSNFDPVAALTVPEHEVAKVNPCVLVQSSFRLHHIDEFRTHLPDCDPLRRVPPADSRKRSISSDPEASLQPIKRPKRLSEFASLAEEFEKGPFCVLHAAFTNRQRVRVLIRYVNGIRGTLTGYLLAFDKHFNMILRDVDEVYSPRFVDKQCEQNLSNVERELQRRLAAISESHGEAAWSVNQRHMKQIMVRGDNVVMVYMAETERSAWPRTSKSPGASIYNVKEDGASREPHVGTPGSLIYAHQRRSRSKHS